MTRRAQGTKLGQSTLFPNSSSVLFPISSSILCSPPLARAEDNMARQADRRKPTLCSSSSSILTFSTVECSGRCDTSSWERRPSQSTIGLVHLLVSLRSSIELTYSRPAPQESQCAITGRRLATHTDILGYEGYQL
jgi:hypothetical protein